MLDVGIIPLEYPIRIEVILQPMRGNFDRFVIHICLEIFEPALVAIVRQPQVEHPSLQVAETQRTQIPVHTP